MYDLLLHLLSHVPHWLSMLPPVFFPGVITNGQNASAADFVNTSSGTSDAGKVPVMNSNGKVSAGSVVTITQATGTTLSLVTTAGQRVVVFAKGNIQGNGWSTDITLQYNSVTKDTVNMARDGTGASRSTAFSLMYSEVPGAGTHNITVNSSGSGSLANVVIMAFVYG